MNQTSPEIPEAGETYAAVDLGSNSFHLIIARYGNAQFQVIDRIKEMVRLGAGLTPDKGVDPQVEARALDCLGRFGQILRPVDPDNIRIAGTNTLRQIRADSGFLERAEQAIGHPIEVIAGREEARLIYLGVAHGLAAGDERRLVVDIGGGSTEMIIGQGLESETRESLHMGCVTISQRFFGDDKITAERLLNAELECGMQVRPIRHDYLRSGWQRAVGSSGTIRSIREVLQAEGLCQQGISRQGLRLLRDRLIAAGQVERLQLAGLSQDRLPVFVGGFCVLMAVFEGLRIEQMQVSDEAMREGLLYDLVERDQDQDFRDVTINSLIERFSLDREHAQRVCDTALALWQQTRETLGIGNPGYRSMLRWAAMVHEIGLSVSHSQYHKHGAYLIENADLSGFSRQEQRVLAALIRGHRRKVAPALAQALPEGLRECTLKLCVLLRLAVLLRRGRNPEILTPATCS